ncbi:MAG: hypothetical protein FJ088_08455 [Deltaproteobacteria bacterium]|nr:hypothetical protein [Deltaproteobacteria bacterium]
MRNLLVFLVILIGCGGQNAPYEEEFAEIFKYLMTDIKVVEGDWQGDFGDGSFYGQTELIAEGIKRKDPDLIRRGFATANFVISLIAEAKGDLGFFLDHSDDVMMGTLGLLETYRVYDEVYAVLNSKEPPAKTAIKEAIVESLSMCNEVIKGFEYYISIPLDVYGVYTYGNTVVTALFAMMNAEYLIAFGDDPAVNPAENLEQIIAAIDKNAYLSDKKAYRYKPGIEKLYLYPNIIMMIIYGRMYQHYKNPEYLEKSKELFEAIQPLKNPAHGGYRSPYSAETMGAKTDDYSTLSSQNYTTLALLLLYENTGDKKYIVEAGEVLGFITTHLKQEAQLLHHWMDGEIAKPEHLEYYCPGCNLQFLYVVRQYWRLC